MKRLALLLFFLLLFTSLFSDQYKITNVQYSITGFTREYPLSQKVPIDTVSIFENEEEFNEYLDNIRQLLNNERIFQSTDVSYSFLEKNSSGIIPVTLLITTKDSLNIIGVPYPSYNSNTGITLKLKLKDYNFFGSMETMDFDLNYQAKGTGALDDVTHIYGINFGFSVPFQLTKLPASWNSDFSFSYTVGNPEMDMTICEGITVSIPINDVLSANLSLNQYYIQNSEYISRHDDKYLQDSITLSLPVTIYSIPSWSDIVWIPSANFLYSWDFDCFHNIPYGGIQSSDLRGPVFTFSNSIKGERINWLDNFRDGLSCQLTYSYSHNVFYNSNKSFLSFNTKYYKKFCSYAGFSTRGYWYKDFINQTEKVGPLLRGIRDIDWSSSDYLLFNFDLPMSLFHTNWGYLFGWDKLNFFNFEFQVSPFFDFAVGANSYAGTTFNFKDGWYSTGFECIVFPDRFRSIQGRISFGLDTVLFLQKYSYDLSQQLFNTGWRSDSSSWYELSIGIGLFY